MRFCCELKGLMMKTKGIVRAENRKYPRIHFKLKVHFSPVEKGELPKPIRGKAEDMAAGGMAMQCLDYVEPGRYMTLNLYVPSVENLSVSEGTHDFSVKDCIPVTILSKVVWCRAMEPEGYRIGIQFCDIDQTKRKLLKHFLVEYELDEPLDNPVQKSLNTFLSDTLKD